MNMYYLIRMCEVAVQAQALGLTVPSCGQCRPSNTRLFHRANTNGQRYIKALNI